MRHGRGQYFMGTSLPYILASSLFRMTRRPPVVGGLAILWGYLAAALRGLPRYDNPEFRRFLRAFQWRCLLTGKARAVQHTNQVMEPHWRHRNRKPNRQQRSAVSSASVR